LEQKGNFYATRKKTMQGDRPNLRCLVFTLIEENKPYETLSLQEIVDRAGVCRNSFYRNYRSKEDIFKAQFQRDMPGQSDQLFVSRSKRSDLV
jgi:AcrR family transcriptional regulator